MVKARILSWLRRIYHPVQYIHVLPAQCRLLITFANSLDPDQARQNVGPDLDPNFDTLKVFFKKVDFE